MQTPHRSQLRPLLGQHKFPCEMPPQWPLCQCLELLPGWAGSSAALGHWGSQAGSTPSYKLLARPKGWAATGTLAGCPPRPADSITQHPAGLQRLSSAADLRTVALGHPSRGRRGAVEGAEFGVRLEARAPGVSLLTLRGWLGQVASVLWASVPLPTKEGFGLNQYCSRSGPWTSGVNNIWELARNALSEPIRDLLNLGRAPQSAF